MKLRSALLFPVLLLLACGSDSGPVSLRRLCPEGTGYYMELRSVKALDAEVSRIARVVEPAVRETAYVREAVSRILLSQDLMGVDVERPIAMMLVTTGGRPSQVILVPVTSEAEFRKGLEAHPSWNFRKAQVFLAFVGGHAVIADRKETLARVKLRDAPAPIAERAGRGDLSVVADVGLLRDLVLPGVEQAFAQMDRTFDRPGGPPGMKGFLGLYADGIRALFEQASEISMSLSLREGVVGVEMAVRAGEGTAMAGLLSGGSASAPRYLPLLTTSRGIAVETHLSPESMERFFGPVYEKLYPGLTAEDRAAMLKTLTLTDHQAMAVDMAKGLSLTAVSHVTDPEAYRESSAGNWDRLDAYLDDYLRAVTPAGAGTGEPPVRITVTPGDPWDHAGVTVRPTSIGLEMSEEIAAGVPAEMAKTLRFFLGGEALDVEEAVTGDLALMAMGPGAKQEIAALIDRVLAEGAPRLPSHLAAAFQGYPERTNVLLSMDLAEIARLVANLDVGLKLSEERRALLSNPPAGLTISGYFTSENGTGRWGARLPILDVMRYLKPILE